MIILQNWLVWDRAFKNVYNSAVDYWWTKKIKVL
jgi:hypothetical protein